MVAKLILALIIAAAFLYALYLLARKRPLKIVSRREHESGAVARVRYLILLATAIVVSGSFSSAQDVERPSCYELVATPTAQQRLSMIAAIRAAWLTLNTIPYDATKPNDLRFEYPEGERGAQAASAALKSTMKKAVDDGVLSSAAAEELQIVHAALAYHFWRSHSKASCYDMAWNGDMLQKTNTELMSQLTLLRDAKAKNTLSPEVLAKATEAIRKQAEILTQLNRYDAAWDAALAEKNTEQLPAVDQTLGTKLDTAIKNNTLTITPATIEATALILELENVTATTVPATPDKPVAPPPSAASPSAPTAPGAPQTPEQRKPQ